MSSSPGNKLSGQWIGRSNGDPNAYVIIDLDDIEQRAVGIASLHPDDPSIPSSFVHIDVQNQLTSHVITERAHHFNGFSGHVFSDYEKQQFSEKVILPEQAELRLSPGADGTLNVAWNTHIGTYGSCNLTRALSGATSSIAAESAVNSWEDFKKLVASSSLESFVFRGQRRPWPLQTSFHRTGRRDLSRYVAEDVQRLHRALTGHTRHFFDLEKPQQNGAFLNLAQHHGFPTPLLDWSYSPYVAAFFAYSGVDSRQDEPVRIFAFDKRQYEKKNARIQTLSLSRPHLSVLEALSIDNDRSIPQQGLLTVTNLANVDEFVIDAEERDNTRYLFAFDLPCADAKEVLRELRLMGITQATLFPGIESICRDLREIHF